MAAVNSEVDEYIGRLIYVAGPQSEIYKNRIYRSMLPYGVPVHGLPEGFMER